MLIYNLRSATYDTFFVGISIAIAAGGAAIWFFGSKYASRVDRTRVLGETNNVWMDYRSRQTIRALRIVPKIITIFALILAVLSFSVTFPRFMKYSNASANHEGATVVTGSFRFANSGAYTVLIDGREFRFRDPDVDGLFEGQYISDHLPAEGAIVEALTLDGHVVTLRVLGEKSWGAPPRANP